MKRPDKDEYAEERGAAKAVSYRFNEMIVEAIKQMEVESRGKRVPFKDPLYIGIAAVLRETMNLLPEAARLTQNEGASEDETTAYEIEVTARIAKALIENFDELERMVK